MPSIPNSARSGGEWSNSHLAALLPEKVPPNTHWAGGCVDPRTVMECFGEEKFSYLCRVSNSGPSKANYSLH